MTQSKLRSLDLVIRPEYRKRCFNFKPPQSISELYKAKTKITKPNKNNKGSYLGVLKQREGRRHQHASGITTGRLAFRLMEQV